MMTNLLSLVVQTPALLWIPTAAFALQVLLSFWMSRINIWEEKGTWHPASAYHNDGPDQRTAAETLSVILWLVLVFLSILYALTGMDGAGAWAEFGVMWAFVGALLGSSAVVIFIKRLLVWFCTKIWEGTVLTGETMIAGARAVQKRATDWKRDRQTQRSVSSKTARASAEIYLAELMDAIPIEFVEARTLAKKMATEAVEVLLDQRRRLLNDIEKMLGNAKRHKRAAPKSPEEKARQQLLDGIAKSRERLIAVETRLHELLLFLDGEAETYIRLAVQQKAGEEAIVEILRDYTEKRKIVFAEPSPADPALRMAVEEVEALDIDERVRRGLAASQAERSGS